MNLLSDKLSRFLKRLKNLALSGRAAVRNIKAFLTGRSKREDFDKKLVFSLAKSRWPSFKQLKYLKKYLTPAERLIFSGGLFIIFIGLALAAAGFYKNHSVVVPVQGGDYTEGVIGAIKYINPLYSIVSDTDSDLTELIFSSLFKRGVNAELTNDLAEDYEPAPDGKSYTVKIRPDAVWQDGSPLTTDDIIFTFQAIKNVQYKSPLRAEFVGVEIEKIDDLTVKFNLIEPYAAFLDLLNFGILPKELWQQIEPSAASLAELNLKPAASGRYKFKSLVKDKSGNLKSYTLARNENYYGPKPYLNTIIFKFFPGIQEAVSALNNNLLDGLAYLPEQEKDKVVARDSLNFYNLNLPKLAAVFFNVKANPDLADVKTRQALVYAIDKSKLVEKVMAGNARVIDGPILSGGFTDDDKMRKYGYDIASSSRLLEEAGWKQVDLTEQDIIQAQADATSTDEALAKPAQAKIDLGPGRWLTKDNAYLTVELTTVDNQEYSQAARLIAEFWTAAGVKTKINLIAPSQIQPDVIRPRKFSALLFGEITGADPDPYAFWHSSQIGPAGLNLADYSNKQADQLLEDGRLSSDPAVRRDKYKKFQEIIAAEAPAIFLYSPNYTYIQSKKIKGFGASSIILPSDRFSDVSAWYEATRLKIVW